MIPMLKLQPTIIFSFLFISSPYKNIHGKTAKKKSTNIQKATSPVSTTQSRQDSRLALPPSKIAHGTGSIMQCPLTLGSNIL